MAAGLAPRNRHRYGWIYSPTSCFLRITGLKPTYGRISRHGMIAFASSFDQAGTLNKDCRDAALC